MNCGATQCVCLVCTGAPSGMCTAQLTSVALLSPAPHLQRRSIHLPWIRLCGDRSSQPRASCAATMSLESTQTPLEESLVHSVPRHGTMYGNHKPTTMPSANRKRSLAYNDKLCWEAKLAIEWRAIDSLICLSSRSRRCRGSGAALHLLCHLSTWGRRGDPGCQSDCPQHLRPHLEDRAGLGVDYNKVPGRVREGRRRNVGQGAVVEPPWKPLSYAADISSSIAASGPANRRRPWPRRSDKKRCPLACWSAAVGHKART